MTEGEKKSNTAPKNDRPDNHQVKQESCKPTVDKHLSCDTVIGRPFTVRIP